MSGQPSETLPAPGGEPRFPTRLGADGRYALGRQIGRGGFGTVFAARDTTYECDVAVKLLRNANADSLYRFKSEFRSLADIGHRNLVRLYELGVDDAVWFVVMELVEGVDLLRFVRREDHGADLGMATQPRGSLVLSASEGTKRADGDRLRHAFAQVARGLLAIHAAGKLHRDLKPSNVLVGHDERAVILDFGLVLEAHEKPGVLAGRGIGTPGYIAPEQVALASIGPAADWYALGVMLHEALAGVLPRGAPSTSLPGDDVGLLCRALLERDPAKRPSGEDVLAVLARSARSAPAPSPGSSPALVGRDVELRLLDESLRDAADAPLVIRIVGESGVGKSTLLEAWLAHVRARTPSPLVLRGRCLEHENVPFKAIDGVIDALAAYLEANPIDAIETLRPALRMFPVLASLFLPDDATRTESTSDPLVLREQALLSLRELIRRLAQDRPFLVCIDDVQWADAEGLRALADFVDPRSSGVLVVLSQRPDSELSHALDGWLAEQAIGVRTLELAALREEDALLLARSRVGDEHAARIAREAAGNPFLIQQLADCHRDGDLGTEPIEMGVLVARKLDRLPPAGRELVEVVALAATPLDERMLATAAAPEGADARGAMLAVELERLVASTRLEGRSVLTTLHDRVREEVVRQIPRERLLDHHRRIASVLSVHGVDQPELLLHHYLGADDAVAATDAAIRAAEQAENVLAFERAADHYATVLRLGRVPDAKSRFLERRGNALANAGRAAEAAQALQDASASFDAPRTDEEARALRALGRRSGELWLRSGHIEVGKKKLAEALEAVGVPLPHSRNRAMFDAARRRLWLFVRGFDFTARLERDVPASDVERLDTMWSATTSLSMFDYVVADAIGVRHLLEALRSGEKKRILRSLAFEVGLEAVIGGPFFEKRCEAVIRRMEALGGDVDEPYYRAFALIARGVNAWFGCGWAEAWESCREAATILRRDTRGTTWELAVCDVYGLSALVHLGEVSILERLVPDSHRAARERGDLYATANLAFFESFVELAHDNPKKAIDLVERAIEPFPRSNFLLIHYGIAHAVAQGHLYQDDPRAVLKIIEDDFPFWTATGMARARYVRVEIRYLRLRALLSTMEASGGDRRAKKQIDADIAFLARERTAVARAMAAAARAALSKIEGRRAEAAKLLEAAIAEFDEAGMALHAGAARRHLARLRGQEPTTTLPGVTSSERMSHLLVAGFRR